MARSRVQDLHRGLKTQWEKMQALENMERLLPLHTLRMKGPKDAIDRLPHISYLPIDRLQPKTVDRTRGDWQFYGESAAPPLLLHQVL